MAVVEHDAEREDRIRDEIVVDAHDEQERAMGWYYYLTDQLQFPFAAVCVARRAISPLSVKDEVEAIGMPPEEECEREMFVTIRWQRYEFAVPLSQLRSIADDEQTQQAVEDWHYWVARGYMF